MDLWIAFESGKNFQYIPAHEISASIGPRKSLVLPLFHAFTGCDIVSQFAQVGNRTAWKLGKTHDEFTGAFYELHSAREQISSSFSMTVIHPSLWQDSKIFLHHPNQKAFIHKKKARDASPSSHQGCLTATYQEGNIARWALLGTCCYALSAVALSFWVGWTCPEQWRPLWTNIPEASAFCPDLLKCQCRSRCSY